MVESLKAGTCLIRSAAVLLVIETIMFSIYGGKKHRVEHTSMSCSEYQKIKLYGGGNYFIEQINRNSQCWLVWDKIKPEGVMYADVELAWTSFDQAAKIFHFTWNGMLQGDMKNKEYKIHPTQKPKALYKWVLSNYAKPQDIILDTHVGSASSLIACEEMGFNYVGFELSKSYYELSKKRLDTFNAQISLMDFIE